MSFFRKFLNAAFWVLLGMCAAIIVIIAIMLFYSDQPGFGTLVLFGGSLVVVISFALSGTFLELCNNIAEMNKKLNTTSLTSRKKVHNSASDNRDLSVSLNGGNNSDEVFWYCTSCGAKNENLGSFCKDCGKHK